MEKFYGCLRELSLNCDLGSHEESIIRDVFIANMQDGEIQRELLMETRTAKKALEIDMNIEMGIQNQLKISGTSAQTTTNEITNASVDNVQGSWNRSRQSTNQLLSLQLVQTVAMDGQPHIDKNALPVERIVKIVALLTTSPKSVENLNTHINRNPE